MKKILSVTLALFVTAGAIGCTKNEKEKPEDTVTGTEMNTAEVNTVADSSEGSDIITGNNMDAEPVALSVHSENFMHGNCSVTLLYPKYGDGKHEAFDLAMRDYAMTKFNMQGMIPEDNAVYEILSCDIKLETEYFVSAVVTGQIINPTAAHDMHFAYAVNAETGTGKIYLSEELVGDVELIKSGLSEGKFKQSYGIDGLMDAISDGEITYEYITQSWRSDYGVFPDMYFTNDSFGVIAELIFAAGGYAGFEIPYAEVGEMINLVAKGLCGIIVTTD